MDPKVNCYSLTETCPHYFTYANFKTSQQVLTYYFTERGDSVYFVNI